MSECNFLSPIEIRPLYEEIVPAYQAAFAGEPWYEVSKCVDKQQRCVGGFSSVVNGEKCNTCGDCPCRPAYEPEELIDRFESTADIFPTAWYTEQNEYGLTLAAIAWKATPMRIATEKYQDVPEMNDWLGSHLLVDSPIMWLDEVFANKKLKPRGNLRNFGKFVTGLAKILDTEIVAYRTIEPRMTSSAERDFATNAKVLKRNVDVPDRRDFVLIKTGERQ